ncbi:MAG TPA: S41 family peptidase, partial [Sedimentisphaerales bacterium]|nr:S41 family peptidase [Sedimentisphaerales bacterium]
TVAGLRRWLLLLLVLPFSGCLDETDGRPDGVAAMVSASPAAVQTAAASPASETVSDRNDARNASTDEEHVRLAISKAAAEIYRGNFDAAQAVVADVNAPASFSLAAIREIIEQHRVLADKRRLARQAEYDKQIAELNKFRKAVADGNDVNDLSDIFAVVSAARSLAEPDEKDKILSDPFVEQMIARALAEAREHEAEGRWDEAITQCYGWLAAFFEDNRHYEDRRDRLRDMFYIRESLTDNACETSEERFAGIRKEMLVQAVRVLDFYHVKILDYDAMAKSALERCMILGDVIALADTFKADALKRERALIAAWQTGLNAMNDRFKDSQLPLSRDKFLALFEDVLKLNVETINLPEEIVVAFFSEAALNEIDPYTNLVWPWQIAEFEKAMTQEFTGIGIEINRSDGKLTVASLLPDTPASVSGLDAEDVIEAVNGEPTADMTLQCAVRKITGPAGTKVTLTVRGKNADQTRDIVITRARIVVPTIRGWQRTDDGKWLHMIDDEHRIGYVRITNFSEATGRQFETVLQSLENQGMGGLIIDLRHNTGGYLRSAVEISDKFIAEGPIVVTRPRFGVRTSEVATRRGTRTDYPLVILINGGSASASEIVAGALQDPMHRRALLVGSRSYGKGSVQTVSSLSGDRAQLKYTMAYYHLPSGRRVESRFDAERAGTEEWGILPDIVVEMAPEEVRRLMDIQRDNDVLTRADHDNVAAPLKRHSAQDLLEADPQLSIAVMALKTELIAGRPRAVARN